jgi:hypothetical protein
MERMDECLIPVRYMWRERTLTLNNIFIETHAGNRYEGWQRPQQLFLPIRYILKSGGNSIWGTTVSSVTTV